LISAKNIAKGVTPPVLWNAFRHFREAVRTKEATSQVYRIGSLAIELCHDHALPAIQKSFPLYDRFLPFLASYLSDGVVIDVGANVGDTLYSMIQNSQCSFLCIEPDPLYFRYLQKNVSNLPSNFKGRVRLVSAFVSSCAEARTTMRAGGTARAVPRQSADTNSPKTVTLSSLITENQIPKNQIVLVKVDTDGFDADCLMSLGDCLSSISPLLYWEHFFETEQQQQDILKLFNYLHTKAYEHFCIFDNVGMLICMGDIQLLKRLNTYLAGSYKGLTNFNRGLPTDQYYFDILACKADKKEMIAGLIGRYNALCDEISP
jgi:FkbM family methyltransferase